MVLSPQSISLSFVLLLACGSGVERFWNVEDSDGWGSGAGTTSSTTDISLDSSGGSSAFDNRPAYYALAFIMKQ